MASIRKRTWTSGGARKAAWLVEYKDADGARRFKNFARKKDADNWLTSVKRHERLTNSLNLIDYEVK